jgi:hypothetical protein
MKRTMVRNFNDFTDELLRAGFSMGGGSADGVFAVIDFSWDSPAPTGSPVRWHTGDPETDPWEWRMRVLDERKDIAYGKLFFKKSGYITREWYPYFLAARRRGRDFAEEYASGTISHMAKRIYETVAQNGTLPLHAIKQLGGFGKEDKSAFDRSLTELQMKLYLTMCGRQQKLSKKGEEYGWSSTVFCTTEDFFGVDVFAKAAKIPEKEASEKITEQILRLNPEAEPKKIVKFISGR